MMNKNRRITLDPNFRAGRQEMKFVTAKPKWTRTDWSADAAALVGIAAAGWMIAAFYWIF